MSRILLAGLLGAAFALGIAAPANAEDWRHQYRWCDYRDTNCDGRIDWRDRYSGSQQPYYGRPRTTYEPAGTCVFQTSRGPVRGYRPEGKDRCCIETSRGPSCQ